MICNILRRALSTNRPKIEEVFFKDDVQKLLKEITRFDPNKIFARRIMPEVTSPRIVFMTDLQLERAKQDAFEQAEPRIQMPPVMSPDASPPKVLAHDDELVGYTKFKIMFVDISPGHSDRTRLMSVREPNGTLRFPTYVERSRLNHIFYPGEGRDIEVPEMFTKKSLRNLLNRGEYCYVLKRACTQFEPDDPRYVAIVDQVYKHIDENNKFDCLRSTRFFGPMALYLAFHKRADGLLLEMIRGNMLDDAAKLVKVYYQCHRIDYDDSAASIDIIKNYTENHSNKKFSFDMAFQALANKGKPATKSVGSSRRVNPKLKRLGQILAEERKHVNRPSDKPE